MSVYQEGIYVETLTPTVAPSPRQIAPKPWGLPALLLALVLPTLLWIPSFFVEAPDELTAGEVVANLVTVIAVKDFMFIGLAAAFVLWRYRLGWGGLGFRRFERRLWWWPLAAVVLILVGLTAYSVLLFLFGVDPPDQGFDPFFDTRAVLPLTWFTFVIMAPLSEEIFFRGFIFAGLIRPFGLPAAMLASGLLFGAMHVSGLSTLAILVPIGLIGVLLAWIYYRTGSLWPAIATHFLFNFVGFLQGSFGSVSP